MLPTPVNIQPNNQKDVTHKMIQNMFLHKASLFLQSIQLYSARHNKKQDIMHIQRQYKQDRQGMYKCNIEAHSHDHCCCGKAVSTTYSECMYLYSCLSMQKACAILYCHLWPTRLYHIFPKYLINSIIFIIMLLNTK